MASCSTCARETCDIPLDRDTNFKYSQGDVYGLKESVYTPIYDILVHTFTRLGGESDILRRNQQSFKSLTRFSDVDRGSRPAIIMDDDDDNPLGLTVCVATTYGKEDISKLPLIFRHFSIPLAANGSISHNHPIHLHALPEWDRQNAYIIAWPFQSTAILDGVWTAREGEETEKVPHLLGRDAMEFLVKECVRRREEWEQMCENPEVAIDLERQLRDHVRRRWDKPLVEGGASTTSVNTVGTGSGADSMCWRRPIPGQPTIPEESEANSVPGNQTKPWKQVPPKHRPHSMRSFSSAFSSISKKKKDKKGDQWDKASMKSSHSRSSYCHKPSNMGATCNFDLLLGMRQL